MLSAVLKLFLSREFFYYLIFGGTAACVNLGCGLLLYGSAMLPYGFAVFLASASGLLVNFLLNYFFNFHYRGRSLCSQFRTFFVISALGTLLTALLAVLLLHIFTFYGITGISILIYNISDKFMAHVFSVAFITVYSFLCHKYFSFNVGIYRRMADFFTALHRK